MSSNYRADRTAIAAIIEEMPTAPQLMLERANVLWRALKACRDSKADFSDVVIVELGSGAGCSLFYDVLHSRKTQ